jgi:hypothetical protein
MGTCIFVTSSNPLYGNCNYVLDASSKYPITTPSSSLSASFSSIVGDFYYDIQTRSITFAASPASTFIEPTLTIATDYRTGMFVIEWEIMCSRRNGLNAAYPMKTWYGVYKQVYTTTKYYSEDFEEYFDGYSRSAIQTVTEYKDDENWIITYPSAVTDTDGTIPSFAKFKLTANASEVVDCRVKRRVIRMPVGTS